MVSARSWVDFGPHGVFGFPCLLVDPAETVAKLHLSPTGDALGWP